MRTMNKVNKQKYAPIFLNYGGAEKFIAEMNNKELDMASQSILRRAKEKAFSKGLPIYYSRNEKLMAEYPDGLIVTVEI